MFDVQSFIDQNNILIGLIVGSIVFVAVTIWIVSYTARHPEPVRLMGRECSTTPIRVIVIGATFVVSVGAIFAWQSLLTFIVVFFIFATLSKFTRRRQNK